MMIRIRRIFRPGAADTGTGHFVFQRASALILLFLVPWFLYSVVQVGKADYDLALFWVGQPANVFLLVCTLAAAFWHMRLGLQTVIEDYFAKSVTRRTLLLLNTLSVCALFVVSVLSILKISFGS